MRPLGSVSIATVAFILLLIGSIGLKAAAGPPRDGLGDFNTAAFEKLVREQLDAQGFVTKERKFRFQSTLFFASRGACRIAIRDAHQGTAAAAAFARDASSVGHVQYLYQGRSYDMPPAIAMRIGRLKTEILTRLGARPSVSVPVALAISPPCGSGTFGFEDVRLKA